MSQVTSSARDHPRTRGEKSVLSVAYIAYSGSPPHTRGKVRSIHGLHISARDHPRTRGEKTLLTASFVLAAGSPPHTRGKADSELPPTSVGGITPAHAGKRSSTIRDVSRASDHPRTRGEKKWIQNQNRQDGGSPPHTRGKVFMDCISVQVRRITPAHAGKSFMSALFGSGGIGSPPHTRGKVYSGTLNALQARITPAHAGKRKIRVKV